MSKNEKQRDDPLMMTGYEGPSRLKATVLVKAFLSSHIPQTNSPHAVVVEPPMITKMERALVL